MDSFVQTHEAAIRLARLSGHLRRHGPVGDARPAAGARRSPRLRRWGSQSGAGGAQYPDAAAALPGRGRGAGGDGHGPRLGAAQSSRPADRAGSAAGGVALDLAIWAQHVFFHAVPALWRLHRVHHADLDYDLTTGARFHPIEIVLSMLIKFAAILVLGPRWWR